MNHPFTPSSGSKASSSTYFPGEPGQTLADPPGKRKTEPSSEAKESLVFWLPTVFCFANICKATPRDKPIGNWTSGLTATLYTGPPISIHSSAYQPNPFKSLRNSSAYFKECCYSNQTNFGFTLGYQQQFVWCNTFPLTQKETLKGNWQYFCVLGSNFSSWVLNFLMWEAKGLRSLKFMIGVAFWGDTGT